MHIYYNQHYTFLKKEHYHLIKRFDKVKMFIITVTKLIKNMMEIRRLTRFHLLIVYIVGNTVIANDFQN